MKNNDFHSNDHNSIDQRVFSGQYVDHMYIDLIESKSAAKYHLDAFPFEENFPKGKTGIQAPEHIYLIMPDGTDLKDLENTKILFEAYRGLTPTQASDIRLWTYLTHVTFWQYMKSRWPVDGAKNPISRVRDRYFLRRLNLESLTRNGLSRLWWYGFLTYDENRTDPWELTKTLLSRADLAVGITERALGCNKSIRTGILEFLTENPVILRSESLSRSLLAKFNLVGGVKNLPFLEVEEIKRILTNIKSAA
ncbi:MAG TPA: DUF6339 family protein [Saprospiraceae bacterium]|nr:DUF6339 family protein [Saprospiraceae bacterium]